jgi:hypothetical protein
MPYGNLNVDTVTTSTVGGVLGAGNASIMKNRLINGDMRIDQRNAGASVTINTSARTFGVDRWWGYGQATDGVFTIQQSSVAPVGFSNSTVITVTTADASIGSSQLYLFSQTIEGFNTADLGWGTANAKTVTLSFWVRSSVTGTFGGIVNNYAQDRTYPFTYTISVANTWEQKSITIAGDTTGTWNTNNSGSIQIMYGLGVGSSFLASPNAWSAGTFFGATGQTNLISTNGATFYITGVQLEVGSSATGFEYVNYQTSLANCQRYYYSFVSGASKAIGVGCYVGTSQVRFGINFPVTMRTAPTLNATSGTNYYVNDPNGDYWDSFVIYLATPNNTMLYNATESSGTSGTAFGASTANANASIAFTAEL